MTRRASTRVRFLRSLFLLLLFAVGAPTTAHAQLPSGWSSGDIGSVGAGGWASGSSGSYTVVGSGADIWGNADGFHFAYQTLTGDGEIVARVYNVDYVHAWSKAGVMMRDSLQASAAHAYMLASAGNGPAFQRRTSAGGISTHTAGGAGQYMKLTRTGNSFNAYVSQDGWTWQWVGSQDISMSSTIYVGLAVTSHSYGALTSGGFSDVSVTVTTSAAPASTPSSSSSSLPGGWAATDVGAVAAGGWAWGSGSEFGLGGSGADIWGSDDQFQFAYQTLSGDGSITARVSHVDYQHAWSKAGVMMRESLSAGSRHAYMLVSAGKGHAFQRRASTNGQSTSTSLGWGHAPYYVRLTRSGNTFTAYISADGSNWTWVGSESIAMGASIHVGLAVTSHANGAVATANFDSVAVASDSVSASAPQPTTTTTTTASVSSGSGGGSALRVLHWNVHHLIGTDGSYSPERIADWIAYMRPDIASLNEVDEDYQVWAIVNRLQSVTGQTWHTVFSGRGNLLLSRLPISAQSICTYNSWYPRRAAHLGVTVSGRTVNIWSSHLDVSSSGTRTEEVYALQACGSAWSGAKIFAGDYNMQASSYEYAVATSGYTDAWLAAKSSGTTENYSGNCDGCTRNTRIDYIFSGQSAWYVTVDSAQIFDTRDGSGYMPSDHKPLLVTYRIQ